MKLPIICQECLEPINSLDVVIEVYHNIIKIFNETQKPVCLDIKNSCTDLILIILEEKKFIISTEIDEDHIAIIPVQSELYEEHYFCTGFCQKSKNIKAS